MIVGTEKNYYFGTDNREMGIISLLPLKNSNEICTKNMNMNHLEFEQKNFSEIVSFSNIQKCETNTENLDKNNKKIVLFS